MEENYIISIGYSIGFLSDQRGKFGLIDLGEEVARLDILEYSVWQLAFRYGKKEDLIKEYYDIFKDNRLEEILLKLKEKSLIIEISELTDLNTYFEEIKEYKLNRQGYGIGNDEVNSNEYKVIADDEVVLNAMEYTIWSSANNKFKILDIYEQMNKFVIKETFTLMIFNLYQKNLIYIMR